MASTDDDLSHRAKAQDRLRAQKEAAARTLRAGDPTAAARHSAKADKLMNRIVGKP